MWADDPYLELHAFAGRIGLPKRWFQPHRVADHYDIVGSKRALALRVGAVEMSMIDWLRQRRREGLA